MSDAPERIYLQWWGDSNPAEGEPADEVTWCVDGIWDHDVEYVRADRIEALEAETERLQKDLEFMTASRDSFRQGYRDLMENKGGYIRIGDKDDELVAGFVHIERMDDNHIWMRIADDGFDLYSDTPIRWTMQDGEWPEQEPSHE